MKLTVLLLATSLLTAGVQAQKVDLDKYIIQYQYRDLPHNPLNPISTAYSVKVVAPGNITNAISTETIADHCTIDGLKRDDVNADINIAFTANDLAFSNIEVKENVEIKKDKNGVETGRVYTYYVTAGYSMACTAKAWDKKGQQVYNNQLGSSSTYTSSTYNSRRDASDFWDKNRYNVKNTLINNIINTATGTLSRQLSVDYGYVVRGGYDYLWILDSKKHPEHEAQQRAIATIKAAFSRMKADEPLDSFKATMAPILEYFDSVKTKYTTDSKADKKMRYSSYYNKALLYIYMDMPEKAVPEADALAANDYDEKDGATLKKLADDLNNLFLRNAKRSRHFTTEPNF